MNDMSILEQFNQAALSFPHQAALIDLINNSTYSYAELKNCSQGLARELLKHIDKNTKVVPILLNNKTHQVIAILGCWYAGVAYCPIDVKAPEERISFMLQDLSSPIVIMDNTTDLNSAITKLYINDFTVPSEQADLLFQNKTDLNQLAYVIYTSGTTGQPKGVMVEHLSITNLLTSMSKINELKTHENMIQNCSYTFDPSLWTIFWPLVSGSTLICPSDEQIKLPSEFCKLLIQFEVKTLHAGPAYLQLLMSDRNFSQCHSLKTIIGGGEPWVFSIYENLLKIFPTIQLVNVYGPTEASVHVTSWIFHPELKDKKNIPIGKPIENTMVHLRDEKTGKICNDVSGEIVLSGLGLARGYWNNPELTRKKFITIQDSTGQPHRAYLTGDHGRWNEQGELLYLGRMDRQIKISGYRIELDEIESVIKFQPHVEQCAVIHIQENDASLIIAFIVFKDKTISKNQPEYLMLIEGLKKHLPNYMCPNVYYIQEKLALTERMKVDYQNLADFYKKQKKSDESHHELESIWKNILNVTAVEPHDDFFEMGGDSLRALKLLSIINARLHTDFQLNIIFENPTYAALKALIQDQTLVIQEKSKIEEIAHSPVSKNQARLINATKISPKINNAVRVFELNDQIKPEQFKVAVQNVLCVHPLLQSRILIINKEYHLTFYENREFFLFTDLSMHVDKNSMLKKIHDSYLQKEINLEHDPLFNCHLIKMDSEQFMLLIYLNHIIMDTESSDLVINSLFSDYFSSNKAVAQINSSYLDYIHEQAMQYDKNYDHDIAFWLEKLAYMNRFVVFNQLNSNEVSHDSFSLSYSIEKNLSQFVRSFLLTEKITAFQFYLTIFQYAIYQLTGQTQFAIGFTVSKRNQDKYRCVVGPMSTKAVLMFNHSASYKLTDYLNESRKNMHNALAHLNLDYEDVRKIINDLEGVAEQDLFNVMFDYISQETFIDKNWLTKIQEMEMQHLDQMKRQVSLRVIDREDGTFLFIRARKIIGHAKVGNLLSFFIENIRKIYELTKNNQKEYQ